jgi:hypothetical protein
MNSLTRFCARQKLRIVLSALLLSLWCFIHHITCALIGLNVQIATYFNWFIYIFAFVRVFPRILVYSCPHAASFTASLHLTSSSCRHMSGDSIHYRNICVLPYPERFISLKSSMFWDIATCSQPAFSDAHVASFFRICSACYLLHGSFLHGLFSVPEDGGEICLRNICCISTDCTALYPRR